LRSAGSEDGARLFLGVYRERELEAYAFVPGPAAISLSEGRWVLAGPIFAPDTSVTVKVGTKGVRDVVVSDEGWLCIASPEAGVELAVITLRWSGKVESQELRLGVPPEKGPSAGMDD
jgi:hypothetical protein